MRSKELNWRRMLNSILLATVMIVFTGMYFYIDANAETTRIGTVVVDTSLNFRNGPGTEYDIIGTLYNGDKGTIIGEDKDSNGTVWYNMVVDGTNGWASSAYIKVTEQTITNDDFESYLEEQGFPESYKAQLRALHELYPEWEFEAQITGLDWNDVIAAESELGVNLVAGTSPSSWKSTQEGAYDWETGEWVEYDSGGWVAASEEIIKFYMDPRNFLDSTYVFQFLKQSYDESTMTSDEIQKKVDGLNVMVDGTYLAGDCEGSTYVDVLMNAARTYGVCPYTIASTLIQEQGRDGSGRSISGTVEGYEGYYNYYNIGAYAEGDLTAVERGLLYAKGGSDGSGTSYGRPWDTRVKSINGGTEYYGASYIKKGQDTIYLKKFNVQGSSPYTHQYMTNVQAAASEGSHIADAYPEGSRNARLSFKIPVFENMPESACVKPTGDGSPNYMLKSLSVSGYDLSPSFDMYTTEYTLSVENEVTSVTVTAEAYDTNATITGTGEISLSVGTNVVQVVVKAENADSITYTITIERKGAEEIPEEHQYGEPEFVWNGYDSCDAIFTCEEDGCEHTETVACEVTVTSETAATCTQTGSKEYTATCEFEGNSYQDQAVEELPVVDHTYSEPSFAWEGYEACTATATCSVCGNVETAECTITSEEGENSIVYTATCTWNGKEYYDSKTKDTSVKFTDVSEDAWYYDAVIWAVDEGVTAGYEDGTFRPNESSTRAHVVTFLWNKAGQPEPTTTANPFSDVTEGQWYYKAVFWASENGITAGYEDGTFRPDDICTRGQVITFLWNKAGQPEPSATENQFTDISEDDWYYKAVLWASENGITAGYEDGTFRPEKDCTRAEIVQFLYNAYAE